MKTNVPFKERSSWGGGRVNGGLTYNPDPYARIEFPNGEIIQVQFNELYRASDDARFHHQRLVNFLLEEKSKIEFKPEVLYSDHWTGARLEALTATAEIDLPDTVFDGILAQIRISCSSVAHGVCSCEEEISKRFPKYADLAVARYPGDWCGYGRVTN